MRWLLLTSLVLLGGGGCDAESQSTPRVCAPGATRVCTEAGYSGVQTCYGDFGRERWGGCACNGWTSGAGGRATGGSTAVGGASGSGACSDCIEPPRDPMAPITPDQVVTFALSRIYFGDTRRSGDVQDPNGWRDFGYDLDGRNSSRDAADHCTLRTALCGAETREDGPSGIDNGFGRGLLSILLGVQPDAAEATNQRLTSGETTLIIHNENLSTDTDQSGIKAQLYIGAALGRAPAFDGSDIWPVSEASLAIATDIDSSRVAFPNAFVADGVWVSGATSSPVSVELTLSNGVRLRIRHAVITANIGDPRSIVEGVIAGVLDPEELVEDARQWVGGLDSRLCSGATWDSVAAQIRAASDIMVDGSNGAGAECDGISIGLGFEARPIIRGGIVPAAAPPATPCD